MEPYGIGERLRQAVVLDEPATQTTVRRSEQILFTLEQLLLFGLAPFIAVQLVGLGEIGGVQHRHQDATDVVNQTCGELFPLEAQVQFLV